MGERKVLNRYVPPDFDPSIIPRFKKDKNRVVEVRMMLPFSMRCQTCLEYMGRGKKFNSRKEDCKGEDYMGIRRYRFIIKCSFCSAEISFKTDPKNSDYECEYGASRNFELWKDTDALIEEEKKTREDEDIDAMKSLENRTLDSKIEMDVLDALDEIKAINQRHEHVDTDALILQRIEQRIQDAKKTNEWALDDEDLLKNIKFAAQSKKKRLLDSDEEEEGQTSDQIKKTDPIGIRGEIIKQLKTKGPTVVASGVSVIKKKRKKLSEPTALPLPTATIATASLPSSLPPSQSAPTYSGLAALASYGGDSDGSGG